jgi:hypothetical protein
MESMDSDARPYDWKRMLDAATVTRIQEIADDRTSGAAELALRAAEVLSVVRAEDLAEAARAVRIAQPAMGRSLVASGESRFGSCAAWTSSSPHNEGRNSEIFSRRPRESGSRA